MDNKKRLEDYYIVKDGKKLYYGYTTGSCAAAASKAAAFMLFGQRDLPGINLMTPKGILLELKLEEVEVTDTYASCAVRKYAGDDPDATDGILIYGKVSYADGDGIQLFGGKGVGMVTQEGLEQAVGEPAINRVPRQMIREAVQEVCDTYQYTKGIRVEISAPQGEEIAKKTFNPRLGIKGGISILGTSGIVVPMSEEALIKSIEIEMRMHRQQGEEYLLVTPGNYGEAYLKEHMNLDFSKNIKCSNYVGKTIDMAVNMEAKGILFVSHIGKFIKVAGGIMDTHSKSADCRAELIAASAIRAGADLETVKAILNSFTTDEALSILKDAEEKYSGEKYSEEKYPEEGLYEATLKLIMEKIDFYLNHRCSGQINIGAVVFSNTHGYLGQTKGAGVLIEKMEKRAQRIEITTKRQDNRYK